MATEGRAASGAPASSEVVGKGLKKGAIGYLSNIVIGVASTAPAYSLAATLGFIVAVKGVGVHAPAVLLVSFVPMLLIAAAYKYLNRADPDAGTTFAWTTRALGPATGWVNGWAIFLADVIVMASLADIAGVYTFKLFSWESAANSKGAVIAAAVPRPASESYGTPSAIRCAPRLAYPSPSWRKARALAPISSVG